MVHILSILATLILLAFTSYLIDNGIEGKQAAFLGFGLLSGIFFALRHISRK